ncbi:conserved hypothetical protein [Ricinus communis]|uniref:Uncharacterized protein n=1 Tax=Ricinus communis TaxID=3988 RepID=B9RFN1_RICCO|nr:conserved hypothetical protein [Ricinus communis]
MGYKACFLMVTCKNGVRIRVVIVNMEERTGNYKPKTGRDKSQSSFTSYTSKMATIRSMQKAQILAFCCQEK